MHRMFSIALFMFICTIIAGAQPRAVMADKTSAQGGTVEKEALGRLLLDVAYLEGDFVLRSGTERRKLMSSGYFLATWDRAERWALVALQPGKLPPAPDFRPGSSPT